MIYLGIDISSTSTGWAAIDDKTKKIDFGLIAPTGAMPTMQRLYFFGNEIKKVIDKIKPDEIAVEETILVRGPKIMRTLARFSGVALFQAYSYQKREVATFEPQVWKKNLGLKGHATKPRIQLKICEIYDLLEKKKLAEYSAILDNLEEQLTTLKSSTRKSTGVIDKSINLKNEEFKKLLKQQKKKKLTDEEKSKLELMQKEVEKNLASLKDNKKVATKDIKFVIKEIDKMSLNIYSDCGINEDIADSAGVAIALKSKND